MMRCSGDTNWSILRKQRGVELSFAVDGEVKNAADLVVEPMVPQFSAEDTDW
jgi:hypothetical protein